MKLVIHLTKIVETVEEARSLYKQIEETIKPVGLFHINGIVDENLKHPEQPSFIKGNEGLKA